MATMLATDIRIQTTAILMPEIFPQHMAITTEAKDLAIITDIVTTATAHLGLTNIY